MSNMDKQELRYTKSLVFFSVVMLLTATCYSIVKNTYYYIYYTIAILGCANLFNLIKYRAAKRGCFSKNKNIFIYFRTIEIIFIFICMFVFKDAANYISILIFLPIVVMAITMGTTVSLKLLCFSFVIHVSIIFICFSGLTSEILVDLIFIFFFYSCTLILVLLCGAIYNDNEKNYELVKELHEQLKCRYGELHATQAEVGLHNDKLKEANAKLEFTNEELSRSVAQLYTLQKMSQAISNIHDMNEMLELVNDAIIGVMGADFSTIALIEKSTGKLKVQTTNIKKLNHLICMNTNLNSPLLLSILNSKSTYIDSFSEEDKYSFTKDRNIKSLAITPIVSKSMSMGLVIIEKKVEDAFVKESMSFLDMVSQQIGIALENSRLYSYMKELATRDYMTGLHNRLYFHNYLKDALKEAEEKNYSLSLVIFDIDYFKQFNDTYGHIFGDKVIAEVATYVKQWLDEDDLIARYGGEEFVIVFPRTNLKSAYKKTEALREAIIEKEISDNNTSVFVSASFGIASFPECARTGMDLLKSADNALYVAKSTGRNCVVVANPLNKIV